jgi:putative heme iron utilization protein
LTDGPAKSQPAEIRFEEPRRLWEGSFRAVLSTHSQAEPGYPFGSVVPYCLDGGGRPILLLSHLAQHCRNLDTDPHCAFTVFEQTQGDLQQSERLTCLADCSRIAPEAPAVAQRYFRYFPKTQVYFEQLGFRFYRLIPRRFHYNGGFATARWLGPERILRPSTLDQRAQADTCSDLERTHQPLLRSWIPASEDGEDALHVAGADQRGLDLRRGDQLTRIFFPHPMDTPAQIADYLEGLY